MRGIRMMGIAIQKAQQLPTQLTSIHTDLAQVRNVVKLRCTCKVQHDELKPQKKKYAN